MKMDTHNETSELRSAFAVAENWPGLIGEHSGFVALPMALLRLQGRLAISPTEFGVLANLLAHRWRAGDVVFPRTTIIAKRMGLTDRSVQRATNALTKKGLIKKVKTTNGMRAYDAQPLVDKLTALAATGAGSKFNELGA